MNIWELTENTEHTQPVVSCFCYFRFLVPSLQALCTLAPASSADSEPGYSSSCQGAGELLHRSLQWYFPLTHSCWMSLMVSAPSWCHTSISIWSRPSASIHLPSQGVMTLETFKYTLFSFLHECTFLSKKLLGAELVTWLKLWKVFFLSFQLNASYSCHVSFL